MRRTITAFCLVLPLFLLLVNHPAHAQSAPVSVRFQNESLGLAERVRPLNSDPVARRLAEMYRKTGRARTLRKSARVIYPFGKSQPVVTCAPLRACLIKLQPGEQVISVVAGDSQRWIIEKTFTGTGGKTPVIVVKPRGWDLTTNMIISTNRRIYTLALDSPPRSEKSDPTNPSSAYTRHVSFYYPEAFIREMTRREQLAEERAQVHRAGASRSMDLAEGVSLSELNFDYYWETEEDYPWEPMEVFDDGKHTYIKLPPNAQHRSGIPLLFDLSISGKPQLINYSIRNNTYITDRVFDKAALVIGVDQRTGFLGLGGQIREQVRLVIYNRE